MPTRIRWAFPSIALLGACAATGYAFGTNDNEARGIAIGLCSTLWSVGLVDALGLWERRRHMIPIERAAAKRVGEVYRRVIGIMLIAFPELNTQPGDTYAAKIRAYPDRTVSYREPAPSRVPQITAADAVREIYLEIQRLAEELVTFLSAGALDGHLEHLDDTIKSAWVVRMPLLDYPGNPSEGRIQINDVLREEAASLVDELSAHFERARDVAGASWKFGNGRP